MNPAGGGGPLAGTRVLELAGIGPGPHACMVMGDLGADVIRIERPGAAGAPSDFVGRNRRATVADLKSAPDRARVLDLAARADVLVEGFRPGVAERLGIGPDVCTTRNPGLVYARMTGWGQDGPLAQRAGHDINYIALTGALHAIGPSGRPPTVPLNLVGDYGGGSMFLVAGVLAALVERRHSGRGQVLDIAMVDGVSTLVAQIAALYRAGTWSGERGSNTLDGGAPYYDTYACADGRFMAVGALEPQFYAQLVEGLGLAGESLPAQTDVTGWPRLRARFTEVFMTRTRAEWTTRFEGTDACVSPVLDFDEALVHPHLVARGTQLTVHGLPQPSPAPRFSRSSPSVPVPPPEQPTELGELVEDWATPAPSPSQ